jgi:phosphatidylglycerophosphatase C
MAESAAPLNVLFDLDGTLIPGDSVAAFLRSRLRASLSRRLVATTLLPVVLPLFVTSRSLTWGANVFSWLATVGVDDATLARLRREFIDMGIANGKLRVFPSVKARLDAHLAAGDRVTLVTGASAELVAEIWRALALPPVVVVASSTRRFLGGSVAATHCIGARKLPALVAAGVAPPYDVVYSDSLRDLPIWRLARHAVVVVGEETAFRRMARRIGGAPEWLRP